MTTIKCRGISVGERCILTVQSEVCGSIVGNAITVSVDLKGIHRIVTSRLTIINYLYNIVPDAPVIDVVPTYSHATGNLSAIITSFVELVRHLLVTICVHV